ncbi:MAG: cytochrome c biogenesis protein CcdA [Deltaproteobacteria bacterium]|nr:cytochrome c biogenesis protein CcdA [Deltaproteobacteria bacterium]MBW2639704.1 cytochrome c biogenesis protein CcdA [Deltaproteobacteria bacterium]MBW2679351.1 cytochrome c biogenesis protein CcdA [Deltaproteobacteria bacterium]
MFSEAVSFPAAFLAGFLSFLSPCVLPLIPAYFTFITGFSLEELTENRNSEIRKKVVFSTVSFVCGFSLVFILMGASASYLGGLIYNYREIIRIIGGMLIILMGVHLTGIIRIPGLDVEKRIHMEKKPLHFLGVFIIGMAFGAGWSPCIGPLLGSILIIAGSQETVRQGIVLLAIYSAGLALPFIILSVFIHLLLMVIKKASRFLQYVNAAAGILLIIAGLILVTNKLYVLIG